MKSVMRRTDRLMRKETFVAYGWLGLAVLAPLLSYFARGGLPYLLMVAALVLSASQAQNIRRTIREIQPLFGVATLFVLYAWCSPFYGVTASQAQELAFYFLLGWLSWIALSGASFSDDVGRRFAWASIITIVTLSTLYLVDSALDHPIGRYYAAATGEVFDRHLFNRPITFTGLFTFSLLVGRFLSSRIKLLLAVFMSFAVTTSDCQTAMVALVGIWVFWIMTTGRLARQVAHSVFILAIITLSIAPFVASKLPVDDPSFMAEVPVPSFQHRLHYWQFAGEKTLQAPLFGYGGEASRYFSDLPDRKATYLYYPSGPVEITTGLLGMHPHNGLLQLWLEFGGLGALFGIFMIICCWRHALSSPEKTLLRYRTGLFLLVFIVVNAAWGAWQTDWVATVILSAVFLRKMETLSSTG